MAEPHQDVGLADDAFGFLGMMEDVELHRRKALGQPLPVILDIVVKKDDLNRHRCSRIAAAGMILRR